MIKKRSVRKSLKSSASLLGLAAGAVGWSGLARAESEDSQVQTLLLPEHYHLSDDGLVTFKLQTGEQLSLNPDQYVILQDGLLLITDKIAQASMQSLPVMGSIRAQLTSELQPVRSPDGSVVQASDASPLWSGDGPAPRLFEEVDIQRYELAQNSSETQTQSEANLGQAAGAAAGGLSLAGLSLLSSIPGTKTEQSTEEEESSAPAPAPTGEFLSNTMFQALTPVGARAFTGSAENSYIGYTAADPTAQDALIAPGSGFGVSATFDMTAGGDNLLLVASSAAASSGAFSYAGGSGKDDLAFGPSLGAGSGSAVINAGEGDNTLNAGSAAAASGGALSYTGGDLADSLTFGDVLGLDRGTVVLNAGNGDNILTVGSTAVNSGGSFNYTGGTGKDDLAFGLGLGAVSGSAVINAGEGDNTLNAGSVAAASGGALSYTGGDLADSFTFGPGLGAGSGTVTLNAGNGDNILTAQYSAAQNGSFSYTGGSGKDDLAFGSGLGALGGSVVINAGNGDNTLNAGDGAATSAGQLTYNGGSGSDVLTLGNGLAYNGGTVQLDLGDDSSYDAIKFEGSVAGTATSESEYVQIMNYDVTNDAMTVASTPVTASDFRLDGNDIHWERSSDIYITFVGLGPSGDNISIAALTASITVA